MLLAESLLGSSSAEQVFIEDVFSTWLYTTAAGDDVVANGIDLAGKGGLVWIKSRTNTNSHYLSDTANNGKVLFSDATAALSAYTGFTFQNNGFTEVLGFSSGLPHVSWTFREQPRFFDIVTYTGNGANRTIAHNLQSVPGCIIVKRTDTLSNWAVYHRGLGGGVNPEQLSILLNTANAQAGGVWNNTAPTATNFSVSGADTIVNANGGTYVAYLFAHDAGGFGATGADNVISCGSFTTDGSGNATVNLGYEPQWIMYKRAVGGTGNWTILDTMRGWPVGGNDAQLQANTSGAETSAANVSDPNATGFSVSGISASSTFIYIAIRRGPMRTPTAGTSVYQAVGRVGTSATATVSAGITVDLSITARYNSGANGNGIIVFDRLRGANNYVLTTQVTAESTGGVTDLLTSFANQTGVTLGADLTYAYINSPVAWINWYFRRAPNFFEEVCYAGTGANRTVSHNLGVAPELMIVKSRNNNSGWQVYSSAIANTEYLVLNTTAAKATGATRWNSTTPTASAFSLGSALEVNQSGTTYVAYLFASCPGVSKVGSYTGTGATQTIDCGFSSGARFILIKRTDATDSWYVWDSTRGIISGNDPYLQLNSVAAEVTTTDWVDPAASGFAVSNALGNLVNTSGGSYTFLAIS